jgi:hypothetical protein
VEVQAAQVNFVCKSFQGLVGYVTSRKNSLYFAICPKRRFKKAQFAICPKRHFKKLLLQFVQND